MEQNGINIKVIETKKFKTICIGILFRQKLDRENTTFNAMISNILVLGCEKYKNIRKINMETENMAGASFYTDIVKKGDNQLIEFLTEFTEDKVELDKVILFLNEVILNPLIEDGEFKKEYFEKAKETVIENINARENDKKEFAKNRCIEEMCCNENFGILADGYIEDFEGDKITSKTLYKHYTRIIKNAEIDIIAIGNIKQKQFEEKIYNNFKIENRQVKPLKIDFIKKDKQEAKFIIEEFKITQGKLCAGFRTNIDPKSPQFISLLMANEILGGGAGSKLFNNIREKESLCYYINSVVFMFKGIIFIQSGVDFKNYKKVIKAIENEIQNIKNGDFDEKNIENAKNSLCKKNIGIEDYNTSTMDFYLTNHLANIDTNTDEMIKKIMETDKKSIQKALENTWLDLCYFMKGDEN